MSAFVLPPVVDIRVAAELASALLAHDHFDASTVTRIDSAGAQLLVTAARSRPVTWQLSDALRTQLHEMGLSTYFPQEQHS